MATLIVRTDSLALQRSYNCRCARKATLKNMGYEQICHFGHIMWTDSIALRRLYNCRNASEATLENMSCEQTKSLRVDDITTTQHKSTITMTSWWARWRLKSPASRAFAQLFVQAQIKESFRFPFDNVITKTDCIFHGMYCACRCLIMFDEQKSVNHFRSFVYYYSTLMVILPMPCWGCRVKPHGMAVTSDAFTHIIPFLFIFSIW